ncbi:MAG: class F sortase [Candidatus Nanopelagicaceae bacterium]
MIKKFFMMISFTSLIGTLFVAPTISANAAPCVPVKPAGKTVGQIQAGSVAMPIKSFTYPAGGIMEPQKSTLMAAVSQRHMPLSSTMGTSVIVWHVNYAGCNNALNVMTAQKAGFTFKVTDEKGKTTLYEIEKKIRVKKGNYQQSWFDLIGPRKLLLATCTGAFKDGHYTDNMVIIATPK